MSKFLSGCAALMFLMAVAFSGCVLLVGNYNKPENVEARAKAAEERMLKGKERPANREISHSPEKQASRDALIQELINRGLFTKLESREGLVYLYVAPPFYLLDIDDKETFVRLIFARYCDENSPGDTVIIYDSQNGKEVGSYANGRLRIK